MKIIESFLFFIFGFHLIKWDTETEDVTKQLKQLLPNILNFKEILGKAEENFTATSENVEAIKELKGQIESINGNIVKMDKTVIKLNKKTLQVQPTGMTKEQKVDFAKFFINVGKYSKSPSEEVIGKLKAIHEKYGSEEKALNIGTGADGGFLVPEPFFAEIWRVARQASVYLQRARQVPVTVGNKLLPISLATDVNVFFTNEAAAITESNPTFGQDPEPLQKLSAFCKWSNELAEDEEVGLVDFLATLFAEAMGEKIDAEGFAGDGTNFTGILNKSGVNSVIMATGDTAFSDIDTTYLSDLIAQLKGSVLTGSGFYMHRTIFNIIRKLADSTGQPIYSPAGGDQPSTIYGYPYVLVDQMPDLSASAISTPFVIFGNLINAIWGAKGEMTVRVTDIPNILNDQSIMVVRRRMATNVSNPGAFSVLETAAS